MCYDSSTHSFSDVIQRAERIHTNSAHAPAGLILRLESLFQRSCTNGWGPADLSPTAKWGSIFLPQWHAGQAAARACQ